ncbi:hypothetical protein Moror_7722 [Moniliophthora roreri MCA 2997]|uniref:MYND-type domain-containing protein n=2 Tax=Moniliophthora roreri TaxID=221103 RepID=V2X905_MONRO|nr:hypothetical protein Moror_7722 [Moniliophthora roreri MCA 2997]
MLQIPSQVDRMKTWIFMNFWYAYPSIRYCLTFIFITPYFQTTTIEDFPMPSSNACHPCLPHDLLERLQVDPNLLTKKSQIFDPKQEKFRRDALKLGEGRTCIETEVVRDAGNRRAIQQGSSASRGSASYRRIHELNDKVDSFRKGDQKTFLHLAAANGDVALAYEVIRMGIDIDKKDSNGATALLLSLTKLAIHRNILAQVNSPNFPPPARGQSLPETLTPEFLNKRIECDSRIATLLIEQHADVNAGAFGVTPMSPAAEAGRWAIVELLLQHGARRPRTQELQFTSTVEKSRYTSILSKTKTSPSDPRPPRPCPCWSGKLLSECHEAGKQRYPDHFLCGCGKKRMVYGECCGKRGIEVVEEWDPQAKWIMPATVRTIRLPTDKEADPEIQPFIKNGMDFYMKTLLNMTPDERNQTMEMVQREKVTYFRQVLNVMGREDEVDEAFWYALDKVDFFPRPWEKQLSKVECRKRMTEWNDAVEEYITTQRDPRSRIDIEVEAKIGMDGGPLYKFCYAEDCDNAEKRDVESLRRCGGCGLVWYCSKECQKKSWKEEGHKSECKGGAVRAQQSHSQWAMEQAVLGMQGLAGMGL